MCIDMCMDSCTDLCIDMCIDMCLDLCIHVQVYRMFKDMCIDMCLNMCIDMYIDMCIDVRADMYLRLHQIASVQLKLILILRDPGAVFQPCVSIIGNGWGNSVSISGFASCLLCCSLKADAA